MVEASTSFLASYDGEVTEVTEGLTRCVPEHPIVRRYPLAFASPAFDLQARQEHTEAIVRFMEREGI